MSKTKCDDNAETKPHVVEPRRADEAPIGLALFA